METENFEFIRVASIETESREIRLTNIEPFVYEADLKRSSAVLTPPGTATLFISKKENDLFKKLAQFVKSPRSSEKAIIDKFIKQFENVSTLSMEDAVKMHKRQNVLASLRYGGKTIVEGIFVPEHLDVAAVSFPYNGGKLIPKGFTLVEHLKNNVKDSLQVLLVIHSPTLSKAEQDVLKKLPAHQLELNVGTCPVGYAPALIAIAAAVCLATGICCPHRNEDFVIPQYALDPYDIHLPQDVIANISVAAAAAEILKIRRNFLEHRI